MPYNFDKIPDELKRTRQWVCWRYGQVKPGGRRPKLPTDPNTGFSCDCNDPANWHTFIQAEKFYYNSLLPEPAVQIDGIGFVFTAQDNFCGIDLDNCIEETGQLSEDAKAIIHELNSYTEVSPSGKGVKIFVKAKLPGEAIKRAEIEMYDSGRFFTMTGEHVKGSAAGVNNAQGPVADLHLRFRENKRELTKSEIKIIWDRGAKSINEDKIVLDKALRSESIRRIFEGNLNDVKGDGSRADARLCCALALYTRDPNQIDRIFRTSKLFDKKWETREDYRKSTIGHALAWYPVLGQAANEIKPEEVKWLWPGYLPAGKIGLLDGDPSVGKSLMTLDLAARITTGEPFPYDLEKREPAGVILMTGEDDSGDTVVPRLMGAGADLTRVRIVRGLANDAEMTIPGDLSALELVVQEYNAKLVVIDPINVFLSDKIDPHKDQSVRRALGPLSAFANRTGCFVLMIRHWNKGGGVKAIYRGGGSIAYAAAARCVFLVALDPKRPGVRMFAAAKANLSVLPSTIEYEIKLKGFKDVKANVPYISWGVQSGITANEIMAQESEVEKDTKVSQAVRFLEKMLKNGPIPAKELELAAVREGISAMTMSRGRQMLGIERMKQGKAWVVSLPKDQPKEMFEEEI